MKRMGPLSRTGAGAPGDRAASSSLARLARCEPRGSPLGSLRFRAAGAPRRGSCPPDPEDPVLRSVRGRGAAVVAVLAAALLGPVLAPSVAGADVDKTGVRAVTSQTAAV